MINVPITATQFKFCILVKRVGMVVVCVWECVAGVCTSGVGWLLCACMCEYGLCGCLTNTADVVVYVRVRCV